MKDAARARRRWSATAVSPPQPALAANSADKLAPLSRPSSSIESPEPGRRRAATIPHHRMRQGITTAMTVAGDSTRQARRRRSAIVRGMEWPDHVEGEVSARDRSSLPLARAIWPQPTTAHGRLRQEQGVHAASVPKEQMAACA